MPAKPAATPAPAEVPKPAPIATAVEEAPAPAPAPRRRRAVTAVSQIARRAIPRGAFVRGAMIGLVVGLPAIAGIAFLLSFLEIGGDPTAPFARVIAFASVFAGIPALISAGGIGRLVARASAANPQRPVAAAIFAAVLPFAAVGAGLAILTIVPLGAIPATPADWAMTAGAGAVAGIVAGAILGMWIGTSPQHDL
jgi:hypothetical protein